LIRHLSATRPERTSLPSAVGACYLYRVRDIASQDSASFDEQMLGHIDDLYNFACRLTQRGATAEDLVQETVARALAGRRGFIPGSNLKSWLFRILRNAFLDSLRRDRSRVFVDVDAMDANSSDREPELLRDDHEIDRLRRLVAADIEGALAALSADSRTVVLLDLEGFHEREIAEIMVCAVGTVKSRLARARAALRRKLQEYAK
jgi:RNA polymerase sigma-70 factor, ECF subfamily